MGERYTYPLSSDDLREVAKLVERANKLLYNKEGAFILDEVSGAITGAWKVPVLRPDTYDPFDPDSIIGHLVTDDCWIGFIPLGENCD